MNDFGNLNLNTLSPSALQWIKTGYQVFAYEGMLGLKVERMARLIHKSKSSFYHFFTDVFLYQQYLLHYHVQKSNEIMIQAQGCRRMNPDLFDVLIAAKTDILFGRELRIHRDVPGFKACFEEANNMVVQAFAPIWADALGLTQNPKLALLVLNLTIDNFFLRVSDQNLNPAFLQTYLQEIQHMVAQLRN